MQCLKGGEGRKAGTGTTGLSHSSNNSGSLSRDYVVDYLKLLYPQPPVALRVVHTESIAIMNPDQRKLKKKSYCLWTLVISLCWLVVQ